MIQLCTVFVVLIVATLICGHPQHEWSEEHKGSYQHKRVQHGHGGTGVVEQRSGSYQHSIRGQGQPRSAEGSHQFTGSAFGGSIEGLKLPSEQAVSGGGSSWSSYEKRIESIPPSSVGFGNQEIQGSKMVMGGFGPAVYQGGVKSYRGSSSQIKGAKLISGPIEQHQAGPEVFETVSNREDNIFKSPFGSNEQEDLAAHGSKLVLHQEEHHQLQTDNSGSMRFPEIRREGEIVQGSRLTEHQTRHDLTGPEVFESIGHQEGGKFVTRREEQGHINLGGNRRKITVHQIETHQSRDNSYGSGNDQDGSLLTSPRVNRGNGVKTIQHNTLVVHQEKHHQQAPNSFVQFHNEDSEIESPQTRRGRGDQKIQSSISEYNLEGQQNAPEVFKNQISMKPKSYSKNQELHYTSSALTPALHQREGYQSSSESFTRNSQRITEGQLKPSTTDQGSKVVLQRVEHFQSSPRYESVANNLPLSFVNKSIKIEQHEVMDQRQRIPSNVGNTVYHKIDDLQLNTSGELEHVRQQGKELVDRLIEQLQNGSNTFRSVTNEGSTTISQSIEQPQVGKLIVRRVEHYQSAPKVTQTDMKSDKIVSQHEGFNQEQHKDGHRIIELPGVDQEDGSNGRLESDTQQENNQLKHPLEPEESRTTVYQSSSVVTPTEQFRGRGRKQGSKLVIQKSEYHKSESGDVQLIGDQRKNMLSNMRNTNPDSPSGGQLIIHRSEYQQSGSGKERTNNGPLSPPEEYKVPGNQEVRVSKIVVKKTESKPVGSLDIGNLEYQRGGVALSPIENSDNLGVQGKRVIVQKSEFRQEESGNIGNLNYQSRSGLVSPVDTAINPRVGESKVVVHKSEYRQSSGNVEPLGYQSSGLLVPVTSYEHRNHEPQGSKVVVHKSEYRQSSGNVEPLGYQSSGLLVPVTSYEQRNHEPQGSKVVVHKSEYRQSSGNVEPLRYQSSGLLVPVTSYEQRNHEPQGSKVVVHTTSYQQEGRGSVGDSGFQRSSRLYSPIKIEVPASQGSKFVVHRSEYQHTGSADVGSLGRLLLPTTNTELGSQNVQGSKVVVHTSEIRHDGSGDSGPFGFQRSSGTLAPIRMGGLESQAGKITVHRSEYHHTGSGSDGALGHILHPIENSELGSQGFQTMHRSEYRQAGSGGFGTFGYQRSSGFSGGTTGQEYTGGQRRSWVMQQVGQHPVDFGSSHQQESMLDDYIQEGGCQGEEQEQYQLPGF